MAPTGKIVLDLAPGPGNPRNSEGAFIRLRDGRLLFIYSRFCQDSWADHAPAGLAAIWSSDEGSSWSKEQVILPASRDQTENIMSVSLMRMQNGDLGLFYFIRHGFHNGKAWLRRSADEGGSWQEPVCCVPACGYYVTNNDRVVRLENGRLIVPAAFHRTLYGSGVEKYRFSSRATAFFYYSDDDGASWQESSPVSLAASGSLTGLQEPGVLELANGMLYGWARTDLGCQYEMFSSDSGQTWTPASPSFFTSPRSPLSIKRDPGTGNLLAVWNPVPEYLTRPVQPVWNGGRTPLVCAISPDDGRSWQEPLVLEDDPASGYCYTAIHFLEDALLLAYCAGGPSDGGCLNRLRIRKMPVPGRIS